MAGINGTSPNFRIKIVRLTGEVVQYLFKGKYKEIRFYSEDFYKGGGRARSGAVLQKFKWILNYYEVDYSDFISDEDALKVQDVLNSEAAGDSIFITPSDDLLGRNEEVVQLKEGGSAGKKQITPRIRAPYNRGSKGLQITYVSKYPLKNFDWQDSAGASQVYLKNFFIK